MWPPFLKDNNKIEAAKCTVVFIKAFKTIYCTLHKQVYYENFVFPTHGTQELGTSSVFRTTKIMFYDSPLF